MPVDGLGAPALPTLLLGVDFTCAPSQSKPITVARGQRLGTVVRLERVDALHTLDDFSQAVSSASPDAPGGWVGGFDFPFGLPRMFIDALAAQVGSPAELIGHLQAQCGTRQGFADLIDQWGQTWGQGTRPPKLPHRQADLALPGLSSTSPLQTRYVPVGKMYFEGLSRLVQGGCMLPGLMPAHAPDNTATATTAPRLALEAYPGLLAHEVIGRQSYKSDAKDQQTAARLLQRLNLIDALEQGRTRLGLRLKLTPAQRDHLASDAQGDRLDAVLCLLQAGWAHLRLAEGDPRCGLPEGFDPLEGWILTA